MTLGSDKNINECQTCYLDDNIPSTHLHGHWSRSLLQTGLDRPNARWCAPCSPLDHHSLLFFSHIWDCNLMMKHLLTSWVATISPRWGWEFHISGTITSPRICGSSSAATSDGANNVSARAALTTTPLIPGGRGGSAISRVQFLLKLNVRWHPII